MIARAIFNHLKEPVYFFALRGGFFLLWWAVGWQPFFLKNAMEVFQLSNF